MLNPPQSQHLLRETIGSCFTDVRGPELQAFTGTPGRQGWEQRLGDGARGGAVAASGGTEPSPGGEAALERGALWVGAGDTRWPSPGITPCPSSCGPRSGTARPVGGSRPTASGACLLGQCLACHFFGWLLSPRGAGSSWQETDPWKVTLVVTRARVYWPRLSTGKEGDNKQGLVSPGGLAETAGISPGQCPPWLPGAGLAPPADVPEEPQG